MNFESLIRAKASLMVFTLFYFLKVSLHLLEFNLLDKVIFVVLKSLLSQQLYFVIFLLSCFQLINKALSLLILRILLLEEIIFKPLPSVLHSLVHILCILYPCLVKIILLD